MKQLTFCDWFSGIGGFRAAFEQAGFKCLSYCEFDKFAVRSYQAMYSTEGETYFDDIRTIDASRIPAADIWCGGFPCTDISIAGRMQGISADRSGLFFEVIRLLSEVTEESKPQWLVIENVENLLPLFTRLQKV
jgi:DNA (cytosine-5)-methyltransferase 1